MLLGGVPDPVVIDQPVAFVSAEELVTMLVLTVLASSKLSLPAAFWIWKAVIELADVVFNSVVPLMVVAMLLPVLPRLMLAALLLPKFNATPLAVSKVLAYSVAAMPVPDMLKLPVSAVPGVDACRVTPPPPAPPQAPQPSTPAPLVSFRHEPDEPLTAVGRVKAYVADVTPDCSVIVLALELFWKTSAPVIELALPRSTWPPEVSTVSIWLPLASCTWNAVVELLVLLFTSTDPEAPVLAPAPP